MKTIHDKCRWLVVLSNGERHCGNPSMGLPHHVPGGVEKFDSVTLLAEFPNGPDVLVEDDEECAWFDAVLKTQAQLKSELLIKHQAQCDLFGESEG